MHVINTSKYTNEREDKVSCSCRFLYCSVKEEITERFHTIRNFILIFSDDYNKFLLGSKHGSQLS